jgi:hypothetical protein
MSPSCDNPEYGEWCREKAAAEHFEDKDEKEF